MTDTARIISANDLLNGDVVFFTEADAWSRKATAAAVYRTDAAAEDALIRAARQSGRAVGPALVDIDFGMDGGAPRRLRERIRRDGPTVGAALYLKFFRQ